MENSASDGRDGSSTGSEACEGESLSAISRGVNIRGVPNRYPENSYIKLHDDLAKFSWTLQLEDLETCLQAAAAIFEDYDR